MAQETLGVFDGRLGALTEYASACLGLSQSALDQTG